MNKSNRQKYTFFPQTFPPIYIGIILIKNTIFQN